MVSNTTDKENNMHTDIRIGTLVKGAEPDVAGYIEQILPHGFESFQLFFWQTLGGVDLRELAPAVNEVLSDSEAIISSIGVFGNPLGDKEIDLESLQGWKDAIDYAHLFGADMVCGFTGRVRGEPIEASLPRYVEVFGELAQRAADKGVRLAFENCPMGGDWQSGDWNIAHNPAAWELMFDALPADNIGLEWEPCHQMTQLIEPIPQLRTWTPKIFHLHGKCATIRWDVIKEHGIGYFKHFCGPVIWLAPLIIPIEIVGHLARPLSLTLRLFGNMYGHEVVLMIFFALVPFLVPLPMMLMGVLIAFIQTFVFMLLAMIYIAGSLEEAH